MEQEVMATDLNGRNYSELEPAIIKCEVDLDNFSFVTEDTSNGNDDWNNSSKNVCDVCNKSFRHSGWLARHKLTADCRPLATGNNTDIKARPSDATGIYSKADKAADTDANKEAIAEAEKEENGFDCSKPCQFRTQIQTALKKHLVTHCKYPSDKGSATTIIKNTTNSEPVPSACPICNKPYGNSVHEHIEHMSTVHQMRASFRCSTCGSTFASKQEIEEHVSSHHQNASTDQNRSVDGDVESSGDGSVLEDVLTCGCGKAYLLKSSYDIHAKSCPSARNLQFADGSDLSLLNASYHCRRDLVEKVHADGDMSCKSCKRKFKSALCIHNHLCRLKECRNRYCKYLLPAVADEFERPQILASVSSLTSPTLSRKRRLSLSEINKDDETDRASLLRNGNTSNSNKSLKTSSSVTPTLSNKNTETGTNETNELLSNIETNLYLTKDPIQCIKCMEVFCGDAPGILFNEHIKTSKGCAPPPNRLSYLTRVLLHSKKALRSPESSEETVLDTVLRSSTATPLPITIKSPTMMTITPAAMPRPNTSDKKYYCKLCPEREMRDRVQLANHLTEYHALPPVAIILNNEPAQRCQTCSMMFQNPQHYVTHLKECDKKSIYIGISSPEQAEKNLTSLLAKKKKRKSELSLMATPGDVAPSAESKLPVDPRNKEVRDAFGKTALATSSSKQLGNELKSYHCQLCNKAGFSGPDALKMHQKYQCINRSILRTTPPQIRENSNVSRPITRTLAPSVAPSPDPSLVSGSADPTKTSNLVKQDQSISRCDACGRGPYNSYYYLLEHKQKFCKALRANNQKKVTSSSISIQCDAPEIVDVSSGTSGSSMTNLETLKSHTVRKTYPLRGTARKSFSPFFTTRKVRDSANTERGKAATNLTNGSVAKPYSQNSSSTSPLSVSPSSLSSYISSNPWNVIPPEEVSPDSAFFDRMPKCNKCGFTSEDLVQFVRHQFKHIRDDLTGNNDENSADVNVEKVASNSANQPSKDRKSKAASEESDLGEGYYCEVCKGKYISHQYQRMQQHLLYHLKAFKALKQKNMTTVVTKSNSEIQQGTSSSTASGLVCSYCKVTFSSKEHLSNHLNNSLCPSRYKCDKCSRTYLTKKALDDHKSICKGDFRLSSNKEFFCRYCGVVIPTREKLIYHQQVCTKVYEADVSGKIQKLIEAASTCSICGMVSKNYVARYKHEKKCLEKALADLGYKLPTIEETDPCGTDLEVEFKAASWDAGSIKSSIEVNTSRLSQNPLKEGETASKLLGVDNNKHPIVLCENLDLDLTCHSATGSENDTTEQDQSATNQDKNHSKKVDDKQAENEKENPHMQSSTASESPEERFDTLKVQFEQLLKRLVKDEEVLQEIMKGNSVEESLADMLKHMGEEPDNTANLDELARFRLNLQTFLRLSIEKESLERAYVNAESVDEVITNLLKFPYKLK